MTVALGFDDRLAVWRACGATTAEAEELLDYARSPLHAMLPGLRQAPPEPECVAAWQRYAERARVEGAAAVLGDVFVQLRFPVVAGISETPRYQAATRRGEVPGGDGGSLALLCPDGLRIFLHPTPAGRVPVVLAEAREDFDSLVRALTLRNEPAPVPATMGACMIAGYNNWDRVRARRRAFEAQKGLPATDAEWAAAFRDLIPMKDAYQDRFMLLSSGPYSSTPAAAIGRLDEAAWRQASIAIRLEHECTHYFMRQAFGVMRKSMLDELVADYMGLHEAFGAFRVDCFLRFMGLESHPPYRAGGRLENYRAGLGDGAFRVLQSVVVKAARALASHDPAKEAPPASISAKARLITAITRVGLEGLASEDAASLLAGALDETRPASQGARPAAAAG